MALDTVVRGTTVYVTVVFTDKDGLEVTPSDPKMIFSYRVAGVATTETVDMTAVTDGYEAVWDSSPADPGIVSWYARSNTNAPKAATEGGFILESNTANIQS